MLDRTTPSQVLQLVPIGPLADRAFAGEFCAVRLWEEPNPVAWLAKYGADISVVVTSVRRGCDAALMAALPSLRAVCSWGVGFESIAVEAAAVRGIQVSNTPKVLDDCVADMAWALLLATARRIATGDRYVRAGRWQRLGEFPLSTRVSGKRLGVLGLGRIGRTVARRGEGFEMQIRYHSRAPRNDAHYVFESSLTALAAWCDFLVVACAGGQQTYHLVSAEVLRALGPRGVLINVARGSVVDEGALIQALEAGQLGGAGLDVLEGEPGASAALCERDDVVLMPHTASGTIETRAAMESLVIDNVRAFLHDGRVLTAVSAADS
jgi:lactate dehydrogenase-like 2-hydroxyacid dehydrogenase